MGRVGRERPEATPPLSCAGYSPGASAIRAALGLDDDDDDDKLKNARERKIALNLKHKDRTGYDQQSCLIAVSRRKGHQLAQLLLENGADPNIRNREDETPLIAAMESDDIELVKVSECSQMPSVVVSQLGGNEAFWLLFSVVLVVVVVVTVSES